MSASTQRRLRLHPLHLLDDCIQGLWPDAHAWQNLQSTVLRSCACPPVSKVASGTTRAGENKSTIAPQRMDILLKTQKRIGDRNKAVSILTKSYPQTTKIFRSSPGLRQMIQAYNGRPKRFAPLKASQVKSSPMIGFQHDTIEWIELPSIKGKILRPATR